MRRLLAKYIINTAVLYLAAHLVSAISVHSAFSLVWAGLALTIVNLFVRPLVLLLTLPLNLLTLGLFTLITNTWMIMLADALSPGITITGFGPAFLSSLAITIAHWVLFPFLTSDGEY